jgi:hypothetical protein
MNGTAIKKVHHPGYTRIRVMASIRIGARHGPGDKFLIYIEGSMGRWGCWNPGIYEGSKNNKPIFIDF